MKKVNKTKTRIPRGLEMFLFYMKMANLKKKKLLLKIDCFFFSSYCTFVSPK